jgi:tetratricopeptide (TPR) repeat protein
VLVRRAYLELAEDALPAARRALEQALELRDAHCDRRGLGLALVGLGVIETKAGDYRKAESHLAEARDIFRRAGDRWALTSALWGTADLALARGSLDGAEGALLEARGVLAATRRERWIANTVAGLAEIALLGGDSQKAASLFDEAGDRYAARDDAIGVAEVGRRLRELAKDSLSPGKEAPLTTLPTS